VTGAVSPWLDDAPPRRPALSGDARADVVIVGAGFTGLWTALALLEREPTLDVVVLEAECVGFGGSGRNGGFVDPSLTHGLENGIAHHPDEIDELVRLGLDNHAGLVATVREAGIDCGLEEVGAIDVATAPWQLEDLAASAELHRRHGLGARLLDRDAVRAELDSPTYLGGIVHPEVALVEPGALVRGLADLAVARGARLHEETPVRSLRRAGASTEVRTAGGRVRAERVVLATNAWTHRILRRTARRFVPVYDHVLMTAPLTVEQRARIGWRGRQGFSDSGNRFHYYRLTRDDRILWGGYDANYHFGSSVGPQHDHHPATMALLERNLRATFPQLDDVAIEHRWGGPIATTTDFMATFGSALGGRVEFALGYTGLGVAASRFAGRVLADGIVAPDSALRALRFTRARPFPFPPEPLRWLAVTVTRRALIRADERQGRRGPWLRLLDRFGVGFDS
jgi:glycine/D-amino acid oxidase-like deaminating enzyme